MIKKLAISLTILGLYTNVYADTRAPVLPGIPQSLPAAVAPAAPPALPLPPFPVGPLDAPAKPPKKPKPFIPGDTYKAELSDGVKVTEFARDILKNVAKRPFVFSPEFLSYEGSAGIDSKSYKNADSVKLLKDVLSEVGFQLVDKGDYLTVQKAPPGVTSGEELQDFVYKMRARDLGYLSSMIQPLFKEGMFTYQRTAPAPAGTAAPAASSTGAKPVDDGKSEYSSLTSTNNDTFLFRGTRAEVERLRGLMAVLDVPAAQVMVRAFFVEISDVKSAGGGVSFLSKLLSQKLGISIDSGYGTGGNTIKFQTPDFSAVISALDSSSAVRTTISPVVITKSGMTADFTVANQIPTLGQIQQNGNGQSSQSVDRIKAGSILHVTPTVFEDLISLSLHQEISQPVQRDSVIKGAQEIAERSLTTNFDVKADSWVVIGGYAGSSGNDAVSRIPFTSIPLSRSDNSERRDMVLLLYVSKI